MLKAPKYKVNYKTEKINLKANSVIFTGDGGTMPEPEESYDGEAIGAGVSIAADSMKGIDVDLSQYMSEGIAKVTVWQAATDKKPASAKQKNNVSTQSKDIKLSN